LSAKFYRDTLGLPLVGEDEFALVFDAAGMMLRITRVQELGGAKYAQLTRFHLPQRSTGLIVPNT
jgi:hypothetical protein